MLIVFRKERGLDHLEELIGVQLGADRVHHFREENSHLRPIRCRVHVQNNVRAKPESAGKNCIHLVNSLIIDILTILHI